MLESQGQSVPISNILLASFDVKIISIEGLESYRILVHFEIVAYIPNVSEEVVSKGHVLPLARRLLSIQNNSNDDTLNGSIPDQHHLPIGFRSPMSWGERPAIYKLIEHLNDYWIQGGEKNPSWHPSRRLLQEEPSYLNQELLDLANILTDLTDGNVTVENETEEEVDITRAAVAELIGAVLVYGSSQQDVENTVSPKLTARILFLREI